MCFRTKLGSFLFAVPWIRKTAWLVKLHCFNFKVKLFLVTHFLGFDSSRMLHVNQNSF